jgi:dipeptidyl aminopeptidase/acylaminoacyl peptidase
MRLNRLAISTVAVVAVLALGSCRYLDPEFGYVKTADVVYGDGINEDGINEPLELDLYTPTDDTATKRPVVIFAHGGSFRAGDKSSGESWVGPLAERGYVTASINYRMDEDAPGVSYPLNASEAQRILWAVSDMKTAIRWFRANAVALGIDPNRIAVAGSSAGAVMADTTAVTPDLPGDTGDHLAYSSAVCTAVSIMGATEPALVDASDAGAIFFHGDQDTTVPFSQAQQSQAAMDAAGLPTKFVTFPGEGHNVSGDFRPEILDEMYGWLWEHLVRATEPCL